MATKQPKKQNQVSLASAAGATKTKKRKKTVSAGTKIIRIMVIVLVTLLAALIGILVYGVVSSFDSGGNAHDVQLTDYDTTPESAQSRVSYFLIGVTGEDTDDAMEMLSLVCYDKKARTLQFLQMPVDTYIGNDGTYTVNRLGNVWNNPTPLPWCETCRKRVFEPEIANGKHTVCDTAITQKIGSAVENLVSVFNDQYSMPVDNYFILSPDALVQLVNLVGGIDVELPAPMKVGEIAYPKGKAILDGAAALQYAHRNDFNGTPAKDVARLSRQRQVWVALLQRLSNMNETKLNEEVIAPIMSGANPMRVNNDAASVKKMLAGIHIGSTDTVTFNQATAKLLYSMRKVDFAKSAFYILPGTVAKQGTATYYSANRAETVKLLQDKFNPHGIELKDEHLQVPTVAGASKVADTKEQLLSAIAVEQSGATTAAPTTTTTTAK